MPGERAPAVKGLLEPDEFLERVDSLLAAGRRRGALAYIEIQDPYGSRDGGQVGTSEPADLVDPEIVSRISETTGERDIFCWFGGRFILHLDQSSAAATHQTLRRVGREIAASTQRDGGVAMPVTPAIGYVDLRMAPAARELWQMADAALDAAKSSLDIEPCRYVRGSLHGDRVSRLAELPRLWSKVPQWLALSVQLFLSLVLGLGAPFIGYAICDALGKDISGGVYIGVVIVLVITATTIWIEGFLALRKTEPPEEPGSPYPLATVIIPAYLPNEAETIVETINAFLELDYPNTVQVIVAYNSPFARMPVEDELDAITAREASLSRFLIEPVRVTGSTSKAQNVNAVIGRVRGRFVGIFDADHHPRPDSLRRAWRWLSNGWDVVQGRCSIRNGDDSWVARMVAVEFEQIYAVSHPGRARFHGFGIFGGSNGFWRTTVLHETRMRHSMLTEDIDSSIRAVQAGYKITGDRDLVSEELAPTSLPHLLNQRLRWAQGWFQVSLRRVIPVIASPHVSLRQKFGLIHLLIWRELFPWYSIQVVPIIAYWVWVYGWSYIHWAVPIFLLTTIYTFLTGPSQILFAYLLATKSMRQRPRWFIEYLFVSTFFYSPFKDTLSRIAHLKEAMRERAWRVTPRVASTRSPPTRSASPQLAKAGIGIVFAAILLSDAGIGRAAEPAAATQGFGLSRQRIAALIGGEASMINAARSAARQGRNAEAAKLFARAIETVPSRRSELLREYADALTYASRSAEAVPLYRELIRGSAGAAGDRVDLLRHLGLALTWSGQYPAALAVYDDALARAPRDADLSVHRARVLAWLGRDDDAVAALDRVAPQRWAAGPLATLADEVVVDAARQAGKAGRNEVAARLFERALRHNAGLRPSLLRDYADQLVLARHAAAAIPLYREIADSRPAPFSTRVDAELGLARALQQNGAPADAYKLYTLALTQDSAADLSQPLAALLANTSTAANVRQIVQARSIASDRLLTAARMAAAAGRDADATVLTQKALAQCGNCKANVQLASSPRASIAVYRERLARSAPDTAAFRKAQRELALALTRSNDQTGAVEAWTAYLSSVPDDADALVHQAALFSALHQNEASLAAYRAASAIGRPNGAVRRGLFDETVSLARTAAQDDRNADAVALFASAIELDGQRRGEVIREYADQLSFTGRFADATLLYGEVLGNADLSALDRRRAMIGLAQAQAWAGKPNEAMATYDQLIAADPADKDLQRGKFVLAARSAAQIDRNAEAAGLFKQAIDVSPEQGGALLREYADQLSFAGQSDAAIRSYLAAISQPGVTEADRWSAKRGLARTYGWSGRYAEAKSAYDELCQKYPDDKPLRRELLVVAAREAARTDQNKVSAGLFAQAIRLDVDHSGDILREYADQLSFSARAGSAIRIYQLVLAQPKLTDADRWSAEKGLAQAYDWSGRFAEAKTAYAELAKRYPEDPVMRWNLLIVSAREAAKGDRNKEAAALFADAIRLMPDRRLLVLKEYADKLTFSGDAKAAIPLYRELLAQDRRPDVARDHALALALALAWDRQLTAALKEYQHLVAVDPTDVEAANGEARMLSWAGRQSAATAAYHKILARYPGNADAERGLAQAEDWQGHHRSAQSILAERLASAPRDLEARRLFAQSEVWSGRPDKALKTLNLVMETRQPPGGQPQPATGTAATKPEPPTKQKFGLQPTDLVDGR